MRSTSPTPPAGLPILAGSQRRGPAAERARVVKGYEVQLLSLDPVAMPLGQRRVNAV